MGHISTLIFLVSISLGENLAASYGRPSSYCPPVGYEQPHSNYGTPDYRDDYTGYGPQPSWEARRREMMWRRGYGRPSSYGSGWNNPWEQGGSSYGRPTSSYGRPQSGSNYGTPSYGSQYGNNQGGVPAGPFNGAGLNPRFSSSVDQPVGPVPTGQVPTSLPAGEPPVTVVRDTVVETEPSTVPAPPVPSFPPTTSGGSPFGSPGVNVDNGPPTNFGPPTGTPGTENYPQIPTNPGSPTGFPATMPQEPPTGFPSPPENYPVFRNEAFPQSVKVEGGTETGGKKALMSYNG